ncbi:MAG: RNA recognition motif domain-containing protein [Clostridia bacterium]|jgi:cold-inducible RNA-binding protein|nr:RNA-binding protein [Clostridiaceae bacterium]
MGKKLYVGNLAYSVTSDDLGNLFSQYGDVVDAVVINDKFSGRSKGFGFIEFDNSEDAAAAMEALNGNVFAGRTLKIDYAKNKMK